MKSSPAFLFGAGATGLVTISIIAAVATMGSPAEIRARRLDTQRVQDLQNLSGSLDNYARDKKKLPESLTALQLDGGYYSGATVRDASTSKTYEYIVTGPLAYQLCAEFESVWSEGEGRINYYAGRDSAFWRHGVGRQCFKFTVTLQKKEGSTNPPG